MVGGWFYKSGLMHNSFMWFAVSGNLGFQIQLSLNVLCQPFGSGIKKEGQYDNECDVL